MGFRAFQRQGLLLLLTLLGLNHMSSVEAYSARVEKASSGSRRSRGSKSAGVHPGAAFNILQKATAGKPRSFRRSPPGTLRTAHLAILYTPMDSIPTLQEWRRDNS